MSRIMRTNIKLTGCGRTDAGVHARKYFAHFDAENLTIEVPQLLRKLNGLLPSDIAIADIKSVHPKSSARFSATKRTYRYYIASQKDPFRTDLAWLWNYPLPDIEKMNTACQYLLPHRDFGCFTKSNSGIEVTTSQIFEAFWIKEGSYLIFEVSAIRFLRNMVRAMTGTLLQVGRGLMTLEQFEEVLHSGRREEAGDSVPAHGLYLWDVHYPQSIYL